MPARVVDDGDMAARHLDLGVDAVQRDTAVLRSNRLQQGWLSASLLPKTT